MISDKMNFFKKNKRLSKNKSQHRMIPFTKPTLSGNEINAIREAFDEKNFASNGSFSKSAETNIERITTAQRARVLNSCTSALETSMLALDIAAGDEVILPSYNFPSAANAVSLRGAVPVFVDIDPNTMNINTELIEAAITKKTRAILVVHYAGVAAEMDHLMELSEKYSIPVIEDAAQAFGAFHGKRPLGSIGALGALSFHATKNINCSQGGAILINDERFYDSVDIIIEKGTNRREFFGGRVSKYNWNSLGSAYSLSEVLAAFLTTQLSKWEHFTSERIAQWQHYYEELSVNKNDLFLLPKIPCNAIHNGHIFFIHLKYSEHRNAFLDSLQSYGIQATTHFEPLHLAPAGQKFGRVSGSLKNTVQKASSLVRLPLWSGMERQEQDYVMDRLLISLKNL